MRSILILFVSLTFLIVQSAFAQSVKIYNPEADAKSDIAQAVN